MGENVIPEVSYPISWRKEDVLSLSSFIKKQESVCLVAMKKVGISNFLRFFFYHAQIREKYFKGKNKYLFAFCDLNDLVEVTKKAFWALVIKRFLEQVKQENYKLKASKDIENLYLGAQRSEDTFSYFDNFKKSLTLFISQTGCFPVLIFLRFDRLLPIMDKDFFLNLQSLFDAAKLHLVCLTTSVRPLLELSPALFEGVNIPNLAHSYYIKPASKNYMEAISSSIRISPDYSSKINCEVKEKILEYGGGHNMLTRLIGISFSENNQSTLSIESLLADERISLALEEIWVNLTVREQEFLTHLVQGVKISESNDISYLFNTGILKKEKGKIFFFTNLFREYVFKKIKGLKTESVKELTKKENLLLDFLLKNRDKISGREEIIEAVWPEYKLSDDLTVSDWAIDRLVWRLREKIKLRSEDYEIITVRGRGYKLMLKV